MKPKDPSIGSASYAISGNRYERFRPLPVGGFLFPVGREQSIIINQFTPMGFLSFLSPGRRKAELKEKINKGLEEFINQVKIQKGLRPMPIDILLKENEKCFLQTKTALQETRAVRHYSGGGVGVRVMKGVYVGRGGGRSESKDEWRTLDQGRLILTSKRIIFDGGKENRVLPLEKIVSISPWLDAIEITAENRKKSMMFQVENPLIWDTVIKLLIKSSDPEHIDDFNVSVVS